MPQAHTPDARRSRPSVEALEERSLLSATLLKDVNLATADGVASWSPGSAAAVGKTVFFSATEGTRGVELWKTDGTAVGTVLVKDINTRASAGSNPIQLLPFLNKVLFVADDGVHGQELWVSDGTAAGTKLVKDLLPPPPAGDPLGMPIVYGGIENLTVYKGAVYFTAPTSWNGNGTTLWKTDGTERGTTLVKSFQSVGKPAVHAGKLYFAANDGVAGMELWASDGTARGTTLVADVSPGAPGSFPSELTSFRGRLFFGASGVGTGEELWASDGTTKGTVLVKDINTSPMQQAPVVMPPAGSMPRSLTVVRDALYFSADDGVSGRELWKTDGTAKGTVMVKDIFTRDDASGGIPTYMNGSEPTQLTAHNGQLYFVATDVRYGQELWRSDGTARGTVLVKDINAKTMPGVIPDQLTMPVGSYPSQLTSMGKKLYFSASDGERGYELWSTDGTAKGTALVKDIMGATGAPPYGGMGSSPSNLVVAGDALFFAARSDQHGNEMWKTDGTAAGTALVKDINRNTVGSHPREVTTVGGVTYFVARSAVYGDELWKTDGTPAGTVLVKDLVPGTGSAAPHSLVGLNDKLYFLAVDSNFALHLYRSDGTAAGTTVVKKFTTVTGQPLASVGNLTAHGGKLYFTVQEGFSADLYSSDGTAAGTARVYRFDKGAFGGMPVVGQFAAGPGGTMYFVADDGKTGLELWRTDGTTAGTRLVRDVNPGGMGSSPARLTVVGNNVYFTADDGQRGRELWRTNGTAAGTRLVGDINPGQGSAFQDYYAMAARNEPFAVLGSVVFFAADDGANGTELWRTDGSARGTRLVKDIWAGGGEQYPGGPPQAFSSSPAELTAFQGAIYFRATTADGFELWKSDGTARGTVLVKDIWTGMSSGGFPYPAELPPPPFPTVPNSGNPGSFVVHQGRLYFAATDGENGTELWATNGTAGGTRRLTEIGPGALPGLSTASFAGNRGIWSAKGRLYLSGQSPAFGEELWVYAT